MSRHVRHLLVLGLVIAGALGMVVPAHATDDKVQFIRGQGSDSTYDIMQELAFAFNNSAGCQTTPSSGDSPFNSTCFAPGTILTENNDHDIVINFFPVGSSNGIKILNSFGLPNVTKVDFARASRARGGSDNANLRFVAFAGDATPWVNFREGTGDETGPALGVDNLSPAELTDIFVDCTTTNWNQLPKSGGGTGADAPILVWTSQSGSGERASFDAFVGGNSSTCIPTEFKDNNTTTNGERVIFENDATPIRNCASYAGGSCTGASTQHSIFHTGYGAHIASPVGPNGKNAGADLGKINGVAVTPATIADGTYLAKRQVYNVYRRSYPSNNIPAAAYEFMSEEGWLCKPNSAHSNNPKTGVNYGVENDSIISALGFVPLPEATINTGDATIQSKCRVS